MRSRNYQPGKFQFEILDITEISQQILIDIEKVRISSSLQPQVSYLWCPSTTTPAKTRRWMPLAPRPLTRLRLSYSSQTQLVRYLVLDPMCSISCHLGQNIWKIQEGCTTFACKLWNSVRDGWGRQIHIDHHEPMGWPRLSSSLLESPS